MCGIAGLWTEPTGDLEDVLRAMTDELYHRGPDDGGCWSDPELGLGLGHRRLSILDLSPEGRQPMFSRTGRYVIVFNGEIYNFRDLRRELELDPAAPACFRGHSDTEVILAAAEAWGPDAAVKRFIGMFAYALWDRTDRLLYLARDPLGIKPLYYGWADGDTFLFASELRALRRCPRFRSELDRDSLALYMRHNCVPGSHSIYKGIRKLPPGCMVVLGSRSERAAKTVSFWSAKEAVRRGVAAPISASDTEAVNQLDELLRDSVRSQMVADVPLGAFLSGGVDSSTVVALMQAQSARPIKTFTIGFEDAQYDEAPYAREVAKHLGTDHTEHYVSAADALAVIPRLAEMYDEPFGDSSQIPTFLVSELARRQVTVALSGDGGDELFGGYNRHVWLAKVWRRTGWIPSWVRRGVGRAARSISAQRWDNAYKLFEPLLPIAFRQRIPGYKVHKLAEMLAEPSAAAAYRSLASHWKCPSSLVQGSTEPATALSDGWACCPADRYEEKMMYLDLITYLPDDILTKVDRASMAVSLEARVPILDHRVVEFAWRLPLSMKHRGGQSKWALRQVLYRYVPKELIERPKSGFGIPLADWLRGPLRDWAENLIDATRLRREGFLQPEPIRKVWAELLEGRGSWQYHIWDILMFQAWFERFSGC